MSASVREQIQMLERANSTFVMNNQALVACNKKKTDRITQLEAAIREIAIPALKRAAEWNWMDHDMPKEIENQHEEALTKLREVVK